MRLGRLWACGLLVPAALASAEVTVSVRDAEIDLRATAAPFSEVLDAVAKRTGMKVVYEGAPPRQAVTATLQRRSTAELILALMEGQDVNYGLKMDVAGQRVETLIVSGAGAGAAAPAPAAGARPAPSPGDMQTIIVNEEEAFEPEEVPPPPPPPQPQPEPQPQGALFPVVPPSGVSYGSPFGASPFGPQPQQPAGAAPPAPPEGAQKPVEEPEL
jgi:hypothetical protein